MIHCSCGFITYEKMESADEAIAQMNGSMISGIKIKVSMARRQPTFESTSEGNTSSWSSIGKICELHIKGYRYQYFKCRELLVAVHIPWYK